MKILFCALALLIICGCVTQQDINDSRNEVMEEVGPIAKSAAMRHGVDEQTAIEIGKTAAGMAAGSIDRKIDEKKGEKGGKIWAAISGLIMMGFQIFAQTAKGAVA